ncbi:Protein Rep40 [Sarcoptes scabiei]|uniref:Putative non-capsid protein NS-1 n=1 Tax=Sarcoptes scabiei TaxID=52283 RepID=A0A834RGZ8_SARSC|nr:Protein Rep40 [Sarcoptes scabiei]
MEKEQFSCQELHWFTQHGDDKIPTNRETSRRVAEAIDNGSESGRELYMHSDRSIQRKLRITEALLLNMSKLLVVPIESSCHVEAWINNRELSIFNGTSCEYKNACSLFNRRIQLLNYEEIKLIHKTTENAVYLSRNNQHYYNPDESLIHIEKLLECQFPEYDKKLEFIQTLYDICEKSRPKLNSIFLLGPANCGKSWFADMVTSFYLNVGHVKNFVRGQNFPLNDCVCRRILLWNEPSIQPSSYDTVKMLAGGDPCACAIKYEGDGKITRTPLIFTSNTKQFPNSDIWKSRIATYNWQPCSYLKNCDKYPHPLLMLY